MHLSIMTQMLLHPLGGAFAPWQLMTHVLVYYPGGVVQFLITILIFWLFAWQVEAQIGRRHFQFLVFGVPLIAGPIGLLCSASGLPTAPLAGFSLVIDSLIVGYSMMNRDANIYAYFLIPIKAIYFLYFLIGFNVLTFIAMENPTFFYQLSAIGVAWASFKFGGRLDIHLWRTQWRARGMRKKYNRFEVIDGGRGGDDDGPVFH